MYKRLGPWLMTVVGWGKAFRSWDLIERSSMLLYVCTREFSHWPVERLDLAATESEVPSVSISYCNVSRCPKLKAVDLSDRTWNHWKHEPKYTFLLCWLSQIFCPTNRQLTKQLMVFSFGLDLANWPAIVLASHELSSILKVKNRGVCSVRGRCFGWQAWT